MQIEQKKLNEINENKNNPRNHSDIQINQLINSIQEFGFTNPILLDKDSNIIAGHGRYKAAKKLKLEIVPTITLKNLNETQIKALTIADNKISLNSSWNDDLLWQQLKELNDVNFDLTITGFNEDQFLPFTEDSDSMNDILDEWEGMPEFVSEDKTAYRSLIVHFENEDDVVAFQMKLEQGLGEKTKYIWYPHKENMKTEKKRYE